MYYVWLICLCYALISGGNAVVRGDLWIVLSWVELYIVCKLRKRSVKG